jgi:acyl-CoA dehydrogenase
MDFEYSEKVKGLIAQLQAFMEAHVLPANQEFLRIAEGGEYPMALLDDLKAKARAEGLWNLFMPSLPEQYPGQALSNLEYAPLAEIMGRVTWSSEVFNCSPPDTGNMEILERFGTEVQKTEWLEPMLEGRVRSIVGLTEPAVASSDLTNLETTITRDGDEYVINGRKWFSTGAAHPNAKLAIVFGVSDARGDADKHKRHSFVLVPMDAKGVTVVRNVPIMHHHAPEGHCEVSYDNVRVPVSNILASEGDGFMLAQARLGPGRIHHCMRTIGQCELALELMCDRALQRSTYGTVFADNDVIRDWIARSRAEIDQARLLMLRTAWLMDRDGPKAARVDVSAIKVVAANLQTTVCDRAMQVYGAGGLSPDTPLAHLWTMGRALRFIDGPDEVHLRVIGRAELKKAEAAAPRHAAFLSGSAKPS